MRLAPRVLRLLSPIAALAFVTGYAQADQYHWIVPTGDELSMKSEPKAPGAPAIVLSYEEEDDADSAEVIVHVRIKILTDGGLSAGTVEIPAGIVSNDQLKQEFFARTIHPDGSIEYFSGTTQNSTMLEESNISRKVAAMPAVTIGSIIEYGYHFQGQNTTYRYLIGYYAPTWHVQRKYFLRSAHFVLKSPTFEHSKNPYFNSYGEESVRWVANLPKGAAIVSRKHEFDLDVHDVPARATEEYMPPATAAFYTARFFYYNHEQSKYWGESGSRVDNAWLDLDKPTSLIKEAANSLIAPSDNDETKLRKLYAAVEKLDNTDFNREHSKREDKAEGLKTQLNADTIWTNKRGTSGELTLLFVALARAAGYPAYPMAVASRNWSVFDQNILSWNQMDDLVAIVNVNGHDLFFDPGTRYCTFNHVSPRHSNVTGVSTESKLVKIRMTPSEGYQFHRTERSADLTLAADGTVTGTAKIAWVGNAALPLRREALRSDADEVRKTLEKQLQASVPEGIEIKIATLTGLDDGEAPLVATFTVEGKLGTPTSKRLVLPAQFFVAGGSRLLAPETRTQPIVFPETYVTRDRVVLHVPVALAIEAVPDNHTFNIAKDTAYQSVVQSGATKDDPNHLLIVAQRTMLLNRIDYKPEEYAALRKYFGDVAGSDSEQIILKPVKPTGQ